MKICYSRPSSKGFPCSVDLSKILQTISAKNKSRPSEDRDRERDRARGEKEAAAGPSASSSARASVEGGDISSSGIELKDARKREGNGYGSSAMHCADDVESVLDDAMRRGGGGGGEGGGDNGLDGSDAAFDLENLHVSDSLDDGLEW